MGAARLHLVAGLCAALAGCSVTDFDAGGKTCASDDACPAPYACLSLPDGRRCLLEQRLEVSQDTSLFESEPDAPHGDRLLLVMDGDDSAVQNVMSGLQRYALLQFELPAEVQGIPLRAAALDLHVVNPTITDYGVYAVLRRWEEVATWNHAEPGVPWEVPGAMGAGDRGDLPLASVGPRVEGAYRAWLNPDGVAQVQNWLSGERPNHGLHVESAHYDAVTFDSSEALDPETRPRLVLYWP